MTTLIDKEGTMIVVTIALEKLYMDPLAEWTFRFGCFWFFLKKGWAETEQIDCVTGAL